MKEFIEQSDDQLRARRTELQSKIDGPENDGRLTAGSSMDLDHWFDQVEAIDREIARRAEVIK